MPIRFSGEFAVQRQPEEVYDFLVDPNKFAPLLPEFQSLAAEDATHFTVKVNVGVSHIKGAATVKMELAQAERPTHAQYKGQGSVAGGNVSLTALFDLSAVDGGTKVAWQGEAQIFGRLTSMAGGLLEPLGRKNAQKLIDGLQAALTSTPSQVMAAVDQGRAVAAVPVSNAMEEGPTTDVAAEMQSTTQENPTRSMP
jgi:carbon monoxide dehydrogenase subunit G